MPYLIGFLAGTIGTYFFCLSLRSPKRAAGLTAILAGLGYAFYLLIAALTGSDVAAYFLATALVAAGSETMATMLKMPTPIFMFPGVVPLVPGIGIYRSLLHLVQKEYEKCLDVGTGALLALGAMAVAIALSNEIARRIRPIVARKGRKA